jgi:ABC-2 type transport system permease protein
MGGLTRVATIIDYEWRRALAKKSIFALIILAIVFQTLIMVGERAASAEGFVTTDLSLIWITGVLEGGLFVQLIAVIVGGGSMSEEYEHGTADILLSKPIKRVEYVSGKFLGGLSLLAMVEALITFVGVVLSLAFFGAQSGLQFAPIMVLAIIYSSLIFFCLSFMFSEVFRGTTLAILLAFAVFIASLVISPTLTFLYGTSARALPAWAATEFPSLVMSQLINGSSVLPPRDLGALGQASLIIAVYAVVFTLIAAYRLLKSDVTKKTD